MKSSRLARIQPVISGRAALLSVAEGGVGYPDVLRRVRRGQTKIEGALRHLLIGEHVTVQVSRLPVLKAVLVLAFHQDVVFAVELYHAAAPLQESAPIITAEMNFASVIFAICRIFSCISGDIA